MWMWKKTDVGHEHRDPSSSKHGTSAKKDSGKDQNEGGHLFSYQFMYMFFGWYFIVSFKVIYGSFVFSTR